MDMKRVVQIGVIAAAAVAIQEFVTRTYYAVTSGPGRGIDPFMRTAWTPMLYETLVPVEWLKLRRSAVYRGDGVPRGAGEPVLLVHGFLTSGAYLEPLREWLQGIGYTARTSEIGWNADCIDVMTDRLLAELATLCARHDRGVHLVGHSLGGIIARAAAVRAPELVASTAVLASPMRGLRVHPGLRFGAAAVRRAVQSHRGERVDRHCLTLACPCASVRAAHESPPGHVARLAIIASGDGLMDRRYGREEGADRVVEVAASHFGVTVNPMAYRALADHLAAASGAAARMTA